MKSDPLDDLLEATRLLWSGSPELAGFVSWPDDLRRREVAANPIPACKLVAGWRDNLDPKTAQLHRCAVAASELANWQQTYTEAELGRSFLDRYGYFELIGQTGHFHSATCNAYIGYWAEHLHYPWHYHVAEELYFVLTGQARFESEGDPPAILTPNQARFHKSNQPHAMTTGDQPILTLILWRGAELDGFSRLSG